MKKLTPAQQRKTEAICDYAKRLRDLAVKHKALFLYKGEVIRPSRLRVTRSRIYVVIERSRYLLFEADPDRDHGLYETLPRLQRELKQSLPVLLPLDVDRLYEQLITPEWVRSVWPYGRAGEPVWPILVATPVVRLVQRQGGEWCLYIWERLDNESCEADWLRDVRTVEDIRKFLIGMGKNPGTF